MLLSEVRAALPDIRIMILDPLCSREQPRKTPPSSRNGGLQFAREVPLRAAAAKRSRKASRGVCPLQERFQQLQAQCAPGYWLADGVHPTAMGHELIARAWMDAFAQLRRL